MSSPLPGKPTPMLTEPTSGGNEELAMLGPKDEPVKESPDLTTEDESIHFKVVNSSVLTPTQMDIECVMPSTVAACTAWATTTQVTSDCGTLQIDTPSERLQENPLSEQRINGRSARKSKPKYFDGFVDSQQPLKTLNQFHTPQINVDAAASILACIDHNGYEDAILRDADKILESYLMPMDFPWMHGVQPAVKTMAYDIDEMPGLLRIEDDINSPFERGRFGYGKFETGKNPKGGSPVEDTNDDVQSAARRSCDPGVIELTLIRSLSNADRDSMTNSQFRQYSYLDAESALPSFGTGEHSSINGEYHSSRTSTGMRRSSTRNGRAYEDFEDHSDMTHNCSLRVRQFHYVQAEKKRKREICEDNVEKKFISVRFGSVSSRNTLFEPFPTPTLPRGEGDEGETKTRGRYCRRPILANAVLPIEVVNGRHLSIFSAKAIADFLGSYDSRFGVASSHRDDQATKEDRKRVHTGRTRMIWTREHISDRRNRVVTSILTGNLLEPSSFRRAREVRVAVKLNGEVLSHEIWEASQRPKLLIERTPAPSDTPVVFDGAISEKVINAAIAEVVGATVRRSKSCTPTASVSVVPEKVCFLDTSGFVRRLVQSRTKSSKDSHKSNMIVYDCQSFRSPRFECLPAVDGIMRVVCSSLGTLTSCWVPSVLSPSLCSICGLDNSEEPVDICSTCTMTSHGSCCWKRREHALTTEDECASWQCASCCDTQELPATGAITTWQSANARRRSVKIPARFRSEDTAKVEEVPDDSVLSQKRRQCSWCPHTGGAMSAAGNLWVHDVCRIWGMKLQTCTTKCVYCGEITAIRLSKCAGNGCSIYFHPMCATLASKMMTKPANLGKGVTNEALTPRKQQDRYLSTQTTLTMMHITEESTSILMPVAFCGYHNPIREATFYGCYPAGEWIGDSVRIPPNLLKE